MRRCAGGNRVESCWDGNKESGHAAGFDKSLWQGMLCIVSEVLVSPNLLASAKLIREMKAYQVRRHLW